MKEYRKSLRKGCERGGKGGGGIAQLGNDERGLGCVDGVVQFESIWVVDPGGGAGVFGR